MSERLACKNPDCSNRILPETAARTDGYCMPCVQAQQQREHNEYIRKNKKIVNAFAGLSDPVAMLKLVHQPRKFDELIDWTPCPVPTDALYQQLTTDQAQLMADYATERSASGEYEHTIIRRGPIFTCFFLTIWRASNLDSGRGISSLSAMFPHNDVSCTTGLCRY